MKKNNMIDAINNIDGDLIENYFRTEEKLVQVKTKKREPMWIKWVSIAACFCLFLSLAVVFLNRYSYSPPVYENAYLSASDVAKIFPRMNESGATSSYLKVYRPEDKPFKFDPLPTDEYINIYKINELSKKLSKEELNNLAGNVMPKLTTALGTSAGSFEKSEYDHDDSITVSYRQNGMTLDFEQTSGEKDYGLNFSRNRVWICNSSLPLTLNGKNVQVDQRLSEEEMLASIEWVRDILFEVFDCSFESVEVIYYCGEKHKYGVENISIYYYNNKSGDGCIGDHISLHFDNYANSSSEVESADIMRQCSISYYSYRIPIDEYYTVEAKSKLISLETAEELLANGYVFGDHFCPMCMAAQDKVSFDKYDYVSFEYVTDYYGDPARSIPFYAFYKKIGTSENGNIIYAKTYVCAVEVSGLKEYYRNQKDDHRFF